MKVRMECLEVEKEILVEEVEGISVVEISLPVFSDIYY